MTRPILAQSLPSEDTAQPDVVRGVEISMKAVPAGLAEEEVALAVGGFSVTASRAPLAGVPGVDPHYYHSEPFSFVGDELSELTVGPTSNFSALNFAEPAIPDTFEVFDGDHRASCPLGEGDHRLADFVINCSHESRLSARQPFEDLSDGARRVLCLSLLERRANIRVSITKMLGVPTLAHPVAFAICGAGEDVDAAVYADDGVVRGCSWFNLLFEAEGQEDVLPGHREATIPKIPVVQLVFEVGRSLERDCFEAPVDRPDRESGCAQGDVAPACPSLQYDGLFSELARGFGAALVRTDGHILTGDMSYAGASKLGRQTDFLSGSVSQFLKSNGIRQTAVFKSDPAHEVAGFGPSIKCSNSSFSGQVDFDFDCSRYFHHIPKSNHSVGICQVGFFPVDRIQHA